MTTSTNIYNILPASSTATGSSTSSLLPSSQFRLSSSSSSLESSSLSPLSEASSPASSSSSSSSSPSSSSSQLSAFSSSCTFSSSSASSMIESLSYSSSVLPVVTSTIWTSPTSTSELSRIDITSSINCNTNRIESTASGLEIFNENNNTEEQENDGDDEESTLMTGAIINNNNNNNDDANDQYNKIIYLNIIHENLFEMDERATTMTTTNPPSEIDKSTNGQSELIELMTEIPEPTTDPQIRPTTMLMMLKTDHQIIHQSEFYEWTNQQIADVDIIQLNSTSEYVQELLGNAENKTIDNSSHESTAMNDRNDFSSKIQIVGCDDAAEGEVETERDEAAQEEQDDDGVDVDYEHVDEDDGEEEYEDMDDDEDEYENLYDDDADDVDDDDEYDVDEDADDDDDDDDDDDTVEDVDAATAENTNNLKCNKINDNDSINCNSTENNNESDLTNLNWLIDMKNDQLLTGGGGGGGGGLHNRNKGSSGICHGAPPFQCIDENSTSNDGFNNNHNNNSILNIDHELTEDHNNNNNNNHNIDDAEDVCGCCHDAGIRLLMNDGNKNRIDIVRCQVAGCSNNNKNLLQNNSKRLRPQQQKPTSTTTTKKQSSTNQIDGSKVRFEKFLTQVKQNQLNYSGHELTYRNDIREKPPFNYAQIIAMAMMENGKMTLKDICRWIQEKFAYFRANKNWNNSIRHNLSLHFCFTKIARGKSEKGKGGYWELAMNPAKSERKRIRHRKKQRGLAKPKNGTDETMTAATTAATTTATTGMTETMTATTTMDVCPPPQILHDLNDHHQGSSMNQNGNITNQGEFMDEDEETLAAIANLEQHERFQLTMENNQNNIQNSIQPQQTISSMFMLLNGNLSIESNGVSSSPFSTPTTSSSTSSEPSSSSSSSSFSSSMTVSSSLSPPPSTTTTIECPHSSVPIPCPSSTQESPGFESIINPSQSSEISQLFPHYNLNNIDNNPMMISLVNDERQSMMSTTAAAATIESSTLPIIDITNTIILTNAHAIQADVMIDDVVMDDDEKTDKIQSIRQNVIVEQIPAYPQFLQIDGHQQQQPQSLNHNQQIILNDIEYEFNSLIRMTDPELLEEAFFDYTNW